MTEVWRVNAMHSEDPDVTLAPALRRKSFSTGSGLMIVNTSVWKHLRRSGSGLVRLTRDGIQQFTKIQATRDLQQLN